ncbi:MAG: XRE family transcriptional regulator [Candidatus Pelethousia sp.]|nr:XRE family transcriptional regulator [Candidatus Pelethousia sp.]
MQNPLDELYDQYNRFAPDAEIQRKIEECHQQLIRSLEKPERKLILHDRRKKAGILPWLQMVDDNGGGDGGGIIVGRRRRHQQNGGRYVIEGGKMTLKKFIQPDNQPNPSSADGKPEDKTYLEENLTASIQKAIAEYLQGEKDQVLYLDCLSDELYGAINASLWSGCITVEQADYLQNKYL